MLARAGIARLWHSRGDMATAHRPTRASPRAREAGAAAARGPARGQRLLAIDLGGTKALAGLFDAAGSRLRPLHRTLLACARFDGFEPLLAACLRDALAAGAIREIAEIGVACIGLAGPVDGDRARLTNLPWEIDATRVAAALAGAQVVLVNDFVAAAAGIAALDDQGLRVLQPGMPAEGAPRLVIGAGTGLGTALLLAQGEGWRVLPGEGGHAGFAPRDERELALWRALAQTGAGTAGSRRVAWEDVVSGAGIEALYRFLSGEPAAGARWPQAPQIAKAALAGASEAGQGDEPEPSGGSGVPGGSVPGVDERPPVDARVAGAALDAFASAFGAFAGDAALLTLPRGGVFVAGGIAPRVFDARRTALFLEGFVDKGGHAPLMRRLPVRLVLDSALGMLGAATIASGHWRGRRGRLRAQRL